jgi:hypothetical protein
MKEGIRTVSSLPYSFAQCSSGPRIGAHPLWHGKKVVESCNPFQLQAVLMVYFQADRSKASRKGVEVARQRCLPREIPMGRNS